MRWVTKRVVVVVLGVSLAVATAGCPRRGSITPDDDTLDRAGVGGRGIDEQALASGSSLERAKRGLAPEEDGVMRDVHFGYDEYSIDGMARDTLAANASWLRDNARARVELEGHCDDRGTLEYNLGLGARRAKVVKDYLLTNGVAADRIATISYGEELPLCHDETEACWARNRRVHFVVLGQ
jgi:peptidoglycan-associated lipoprotein